MNCLIIGGASGLGRALSETLAGAGHNLMLLSSDMRDAAAVATDLSIRFPVKAVAMGLDLRDFSPAQIRAAFYEKFEQLDALFMVAGIIHHNELGAIDDKALRDLIEINFVSTVRIVNEFISDLQRSPHGNCVGVGSIAAGRPRKHNVLYGATKSALEFYFLGLRHLLAGSSCKVQFYRLGYMRSQMTFGRKLLFPAAEPQQVARQITMNLNKDIGLSYLPYWWKWVILVYRLIPWPIYKRLSIR